MLNDMFGGTKSEMQRLLEEAEKLPTAMGQEFDLSNLSDVYTAIHLVQENLGITGATALEAETTFVGATGMMKASWDNFMSGAGDVQPFIDAFGNLATLVVTRITEILPRLVEGLTGIVQGLVPLIMPLLQQLLPAIIEGATGLVDALLAELPNLINVIVAALPMIIEGILSLLPSLVDAGMQMLTSLINGVSEMIPTLIPMAIEIVFSLIDTIIENAPALLDAGLELLTQLGEGILKAIPTIIEKLPEIIEKIIDFIINAREQIVETGLKLFVALIEALPEIISGIVEALPKIITSIIDALITGIPLLVKTGVTLFVALIKNLPAIISELLGAIPKIIKSIVDGFTGKQDEIKKSGFDLFVSLIKDIANVITNIKKAVADIVDGIKEKFLSFTDSIIKIGSDIVGGVIKGIKNKASEAFAEVGRFAQGLLDKAKGVLGIKSPSRVFEEQFGAQIVTGAEQGISKNATKAEKAAEKMAKGTLDAAKLWIQDYKQSTDYLASEEIKMWEALGAKYAEGSKQRVEIDKQRIEAQKGLGKEQETILNNITKLEDDYQKKLDDRTQAIFNSFGLFDQITEKENTREKEFQTATENHNKLIESIHDLNMELAKTDSFDKQIEIMNKIQEEQAKLTESTKTLGLAKEQAMKSEGQVMIENLQKQVDVMTEWANDLESLSNRGVNDGLLANLREMNPQAYQEVDNLNNMTDTELTTWVDLVSKKAKIAKDAAVAETKGLRTDVDAQIKGLSADLAATMPEQGKTAGVSFIQGIIDGIKSGSSELRATAQQIASDLNVATSSSNTGVSNGKATATSINNTQNSSSTANKATVTIHNNNIIGSNMDATMVSKKISTDTTNSLRSQGIIYG